MLLSRYHSCVLVISLILLNSNSPLINASLNKMPLYFVIFSNDGLNRSQVFILLI